MNFLDIRTLSLVTGTTALAMFICMLHVARRRKTYPGFNYWSAAFMANCFGLVAMSTRNWLPDALSILVANFLIQAAAILICRGLAKFSGARQITWLDIAGPVCLLAALAYFTYVEYNVQTRTGFITFWLAVFYLRAAWLAWLWTGRVLGRRNWLLVGALSFLGFWMVFYCIDSWFINKQLKDLMIGGAVHGLSFIVYLLSTTVIMAGLLSINSTRVEQDLTSAKAEIVDLKSFLPICAKCKKIRDDQGYWQQVERYITDHTGAEMTHSICPECAAKLYPELNTAKLK